MRRSLAVAAALAALVLPGSAVAHPLGNFTINRFARLEVRGHVLYVRYVLDMAEIPAYEARQRGVEAGGLARRLAAGLDLRVAGRRARLAPVRRALAFPRGAAGLRTLRLEAVLRGPRLARAARVTLRDRNYEGRIGWREIVVGAHAPSASHELRAYPRKLLRSPPDVTSVAARLVPGAGPSIPPPLPRGRALRAPDRVADAGFASLVARRHAGPLVVLAALAAALFWGAAHALSPGHGKTIVAAYLVGRRGTPRHALLLGLVVTATHTAGVFALGLVTLALSGLVVPDRLYPWLNLASGVLVVAIGVSVLAARVRHRPGHAHGHDHDHARHAPGGVGGRSLLAVGVSGGLLPCPSALVVLLAAVSLHRIAFGLLLIVAFSAGLALAVTGAGLAAVLAKRALGGARLDGRFAALLPAASALVIVAAGVAMTAHALPKVG